jgi:hypothetical protein
LGRITSRLVFWVSILGNAGHNNISRKRGKPETRIIRIKMKKIFLLTILLFQLTFVFGQDRTFSYVDKYENDEKLKLLAESINKPLLITENKIYSIGSDCLTRLFDNNINERNDDGDSNERFKDGENDERKKGGDIAYRTKKSKKNKRNKDGNSNDRDDDGDVNNRNSDGNSNNRNADGLISDGPRCSYTKNGKILLYTRQEINSKKAKIYYNNKYFSNKYFKIIKL